MIDVSVLTICTREKRLDHPRKLVKRDFAELTRRLWREQELGHLATPAARLYTGLPQRRLLAGVGKARRSGAARVKLWILSAGYGLVHESMPLVPYDCSFNAMNASQLAEWSRHLCLPDTFPMFLSTPADLRLVLLTDPYLRACPLGDGLSLAAPTVFVVSRAMAPRLPRGARAWILERADVSRFRTPAVALRQQVGALALELIAAEGRAGLDLLLSSGDAWRETLRADQSAGGGGGVSTSAAASTS